MRRHVVLTHLAYPAKRYIVATGPEAAWLLAAGLVAAIVWRRLLPLCTRLVATDPATGSVNVVAEAPLLVWAEMHLAPALAESVGRSVAFVPLAAALAVFGLLALVILWAPEEKKLHCWATTYARTWLRTPRVATSQPTVQARSGGKRAP